MDIISAGDLAHYKLFPIFVKNYSNMEENNKTNVADIDRKDLFTKIPLRYRVAKWWLRTFCNKTLWKGDIGGFKFQVRKYWIDIRSIAKNEWNLRLGHSSYAYGYFLHIIMEMKNALANGDTNTAEALKQHFAFYATNVSITSNFILSDTKFTNAIMREIDWSVKRIFRKSAEEAKAATKEQEDADEAFMQSAVERGQMNRQQRRKVQREERKAMKKAFKNDPVVRDMINDNESTKE